MTGISWKIKKLRQPLPKKRLKAYDRAMHIHTDKTREDDNIFEGEYQVKIPASVAISRKDPAAILHTVFERMYPGKEQNAAGRTL